MRDRAVSLLASYGERYLIQTRHVVKEGRTEGKYDFIFPGACSLFGGGLREREHQKVGLTRIMGEQLEGLNLPWEMEPREYCWRRDLPEVLQRLESVFGGNVQAFLGFDLDGRVPQQALGKDRGHDLTYRAFLYGLDRDHYFVTRFLRSPLEGVTVKEGTSARLPHHEIARSLVMIPGDKLALLDDIATRVLNQELTI